jgi:hypothetical protein
MYRCGRSVCLACLSVSPVCLSRQSVSSVCQSVSLSVSSVCLSVSSLCLSHHSVCLPVCLSAAPSKEHRRLIIFATRIRTANTIYRYQRKRRRRSGLASCGLADKKASLHGDPRITFRRLRFMETDSRQITFRRTLNEVHIQCVLF